MKAYIFFLQFLPFQLMLSAILVSYCSYLYFFFNDISIPFGYADIRPEEVAPLFLKIVGCFLAAALIPVRLFSLLRLKFFYSASRVQRTVLSSKEKSQSRTPNISLRIPGYAKLLFFSVTLALFASYMMTFYHYFSDPYRPDKVFINSPFSQLLFFFYSFSLGVLSFAYDRSVLRYVFFVFALLSSNAVLVLDCSRFSLLPFAFILLASISRGRYLRSMLVALLIALYVSGALVARDLFDTFSMDASTALLFPFVYSFFSVQSLLSSLFVYTFAFSFPNLLVGSLKYPQYSISDGLSYISAHVSPLPSSFIDVRLYRIDVYRPLPALSEVDACLGPLGLIVLFLVIFLTLIYFTSLGKFGFAASMILSVYSTVMLFQYNLRALSRYYVYGLILAFLLKSVYPYIKRQALGEEHF